MLHTHSKTLASQLSPSILLPHLNLLRDRLCLSHDLSSLSPLAPQSPRFRPSLASLSYKSTLLVSLQTLAIVVYIVNHEREVLTHYNKCRCYGEKIEDCEELTKSCGWRIFSLSTNLLFVLEWGRLGTNQFIKQHIQEIKQGIQTSHGIGQWSWVAMELDAIRGHSFLLVLGGISSLVVHGINGQFPILIMWNQSLEGGSQFQNENCLLWNRSSLLASS